MSWSSEEHIIPRRCARAGCSNTFLKKMPWHTYCSKTCHLAAWRYRKGKTKDGPGRKFRRFSCRRGHELTPDNVRYEARGGRTCLTCQRENQRARRARLAA